MKLLIHTMGIEQDVQQLNFRNDHQKAVINLIFTHNWIRDKMSSFFDDEHITPQQFNILRILRGSHPTPLSTLQIRERMLDKMSDTSRIVDRLIVKKLVKKVTCQSDRRLVDITITEEGLELLDRLDHQQEAMDDILKNLTKKEAVTLSNLLDKIRTGE